MISMINEIIVNGQWSMINDVDTDLLLWLNSAHNAFFDVFMMLFTGKWIWIPMYLSLAYLLLKNMTAKQAMMCIVAIALVIVVTDQMSSSLIRHAVGRLRPANLENPISDMVHIVDGYRGGRYGFPSSHAANSFGLVFFLYFLMRRSPLPAFMMVWAIVNCYSRIYLGVHYPGDILCGALVGLLGATIVWLIYRRLTKQEALSEVRQWWAPIVVCLLTVVGISLYAYYSIQI
ncbi:MAG: phosphatase PAP2 family protein [Bacteroidaceae bacterium]|nr:phosphatase PAP2 family protein [Bacteroidaceae bacterium]